MPAAWWDTALLELHISTQLIHLALHACCQLGLFKPLRHLLDFLLLLLDSSLHLSPFNFPLELVHHSLHRQAVHLPLHVVLLLLHFKPQCRLLLHGGHSQLILDPLLEEGVLKSLDLELLGRSGLTVPHGRLAALQLELAHTKGKLSCSWLLRCRHGLERASCCRGAGPGRAQ